VLGWVRIAPHSPLAEVLRSTSRWWLLGSGPARRLEVSAFRRQGAGLVAKWAGCDSPEAAEALKGAQVAVARGDFPRLRDREYYWVDLIGLQVVNRSDRKLGLVKGLRTSAAHDLLEIEPVPSGPEILVPVVGDFIDGIDLDAGTIRVNWEPEWLA
jgi:16S rRNA processing protein RimM